MSRYCDKCDFADTIDINGVDNVLKAKIYIGDSEEPINATGYQDLIPYLAHIVSAMCGGKDGCTYIRLTEKPWPEYEEAERLELYKSLLVRYYNRCKRKKEEFDIDTACKQISCWSIDDTTRELAKRVKESGKKAKTDDLHYPIFDMYRQNLIDEMVKYGLNPVEYGYGRLYEC